MLHSLLGFHTDILKETPLSEQSGYRMVSILFAAVCLSMVAADAFFGHMFHSGWLAIILSGHFLGYIHFAVYRLALITLTTRPLHLANELMESGKSEGLKAWFQPDAAAVLRLVFVGLIALAVSFPGAAIFFAGDVEQIQENHRLMLIDSNNSEISKAALLDPGLRFPFEVIRELLTIPSYKLMVFIWAVWIFSPLLLLSVLRHGSGMEYTRKLAIHHRSLVERDFYTHLLEAQQELSADFATSISLKDAHVYEDPPFNTKLKVLPNRKFGGREDFTSYLQSL